MHKSNRVWTDLPSEVENDTLYRQGHSGGAMATDTFTMSVPFSPPVDPQCGFAYFNCIMGNIRLPIIQLKISGSGGLETPRP